MVEALSKCFGFLIFLFSQIEKLSLYQLPNPTNFKTKTVTVNLMVL